MLNIRLFILFLLFSFSLPTYAFFGLFQPNVDAVKERLKDPYSAKFHKVVDHKLGVVCGEVNSKNSMGAYTGNKLFLIYENTAYFLEDDPDLLIALCINYPTCQKQGNQPQQCMDEHIVSIAEKKSIEKANKNNPKNRKLKSMGNKACIEWGARGINAERQTKTCRSLVDSCVNEHSINGPEAIAECISKISMISDKAPYFLTLIGIEKQNALIGKYPDETNLTNTQANDSLKKRGLQACNDKTLYGNHSEDKEQEKNECIDVVNKCFDEFKDDDYKKTNDCMIPAVGIGNWNYMLYEIRNN